MSRATINSFKLLKPLRRFEFNEHAVKVRDSYCVEYLRYWKM